MQVREEELAELDQLSRSACPLPIRGGIENAYGKCAVLLQTYISNVRPQGFTLISDTMYVSQNAGRIARGLFDIALKVCLGLFFISSFFG